MENFYKMDLQKILDDLQTVFPSEIELLVLHTLKTWTWKKNLIRKFWLI